MTGLISSHTTKKTLRMVVVAVGLLSFANVVIAQQSMSPAELEAHIKEKKAELEAAIMQREATLAKRAELEKNREQEVERQKDLELELRTLCEERETADPGSLDACLTELNIEAQ